jgi:hypothetical protein
MRIRYIFCVENFISGLVREAVGSIMVAHQSLFRVHRSYFSFVSHWHMDSEPFTGGDALFTALTKGWELDENVMCEAYWHYGSRRVLVYLFELRRGDEVVIMPVVDNPYVSRLLNELALKIVTAESQKIPRLNNSRSALPTPDDIGGDAHSL